MIDYLRIFWRGFLIVALTAANVVQVSSGHFIGAGFIGAAISWTWWSNAHTAAHRDRRGAGLVYGFGAGVGTLVGMVLTRWWYGLGT